MCFDPCNSYSRSIVGVKLMLLIEVIVIVFDIFLWVVGNSLPFHYSTNILYVFFLHFMLKQFVKFSIIDVIQILSQLLPNTILNRLKALHHRRSDLPLLQFSRYSRSSIFSLVHWYFRWLVVYCLDWSVFNDIDDWRHCERSHRNPVQWKKHLLSI